MTEQLNRIGLKKKVEEMISALKEIADNPIPHISILSLYALPPWATRREPDLDLLIVVEEDFQSDLIGLLDRELAQLAKNNLDFDAWILTAAELRERG